MDKSEAGKPVETFIIEHSSNSNSDLICIPSNNDVRCNLKSATGVPSVVIDLQDTYSSMNSIISKDFTNASSSLRKKKSFYKKTEKKNKKERNASSCQIRACENCDIQNTKNTSYEHKGSPDNLLLDENSHSVCPTVSNISEILSLSNSSMSSAFSSANAMSKNIFQSAQNELVSSSIQMSKSDLTFAGKFKQSTSSTSTGCNISNYNSDCTNVNLLNNNSPNQNKFSLFGGSGTTNSNDSSSNSRTSSFHDVVYAVKMEASNIKRNAEDSIAAKHDINEKSMSNMSNKGFPSADNAFAPSALTIAEQHHQQSIDLTMDFSSHQVVKQPKKRGRKKGSKGVDSVISKETSLSSQMLISSIGVGGKKVKTTKELYAEMESRKLRNAKLTRLAEIPINSSENYVEKQHQAKTISSRHPSFCSDIIESDSCTMTSEPSRESGNILSRTTISKLLDNNSICSKHDYEFKTGDINSNEVSRHSVNENFALDITPKINQEIQNILKLLKPHPCIRQIEYECFNSITPCTCTIGEVTDSADNEFKEIIGNNSKDSNFNATNSTNITAKEDDHLKKIQIDQMANVADNLKRSDKDQKATWPEPPPPPSMKVKKSIFDLDFGDDEDPLNSIIADIASKNLKSEREAIISPAASDDKSELPWSIEDDFNRIDHQNTPYALNVPTTSSDNIIFPSYEVKYDPDCEAKNRFEVQTQKITNFHIDTLHNCFIPNVNGNWNHAAVNDTRNHEKDKDGDHKADSIVDGYDVVPFYGSDKNEDIAKDLSHVKFTKKFNVKRSRGQNHHEILFHMPFLGVSRIPDVANTKLRRKSVKRRTLDEEKENVDNKINLNNKITNTSALVIDNTKERGEVMRMESVQDAEMSLNTIKLKTSKSYKRPGFKRTKRREIKRLQLAANGNLEANSNDSSDSDYVNGLMLHRSLFYHEEICQVVKNGSRLHKECIFHISSCSSGCNSTDEEAIDKMLYRKTRTVSSSSSSSLSASSEYHILNLQREIIQAEYEKRPALTFEHNRKIVSNDELSDAPTIENTEEINANYITHSDNNDDNDDNALPEENNRMLLSFNNIYNKSTRNENAELQNNDPGNNMLKQRFQNCDDYSNLNNFNLIKYIDNKTSSVNNNNNDSYSNNHNHNTNFNTNLSDININISNSSCSHQNPTNSTHNHQHNKNNNDNDIQSKPFKEYDFGILVVEGDVNGDDDNNCSRLQQFKEWHEVVQLRSYKDELLTVLPYVVLE